MENTYYSNTEMGWDDEIADDGKKAIILTEGDYAFRVTGLEKGRFPGSAKLPSCNKAGLTLEVETPDGTANVKTDIILHRSLEWKISSFFRCIGQKQHGERVQMNWNKVLGATGVAHFKPREYTDRYGATKQANEVAYFIDKDQGVMSTTDTDDIPF